MILVIYLRNGNEGFYENMAFTVTFNSIISSVNENRPSYITPITVSAIRVLLENRPHSDG